MRKHTMTIRFGATGATLSGAAGTVNFTSLNNSERKALASLVSEAVGITRRWKAAA